jgi:hypothetical protein
MGRIRTIKPEFPQSETVGVLSREARLLFIQLWTVADDEGRSRAAPRMLASILYPYDDDASNLIEDWLKELECNNAITRYEVNGSTYLHITNWLKHQRIDRPTPSKLPEPVTSSRSQASSREGSRVFDEVISPENEQVWHDSLQVTDSIEFDDGSRAFDEGSTADRKGTDSNGQDQLTSLRSDVAPSGAPRATRGSRLPRDWKPSSDDQRYASDRGVNHDRIAEDFRGYWCAKAGKDAVKTDWSLTWQNWVRREADRRGTTTPPKVDPRSGKTFTPMSGAL